MRRRRKGARGAGPECSWANRLPGIFIYCGVIVKEQPWRALPLLQYIDLIYRAYVDYQGHAWLLYDKSFHMRAAICPNLHWDLPQPGLRLQYMTLARPSTGDRFDSGHLIHKAGQMYPTRGAMGQVVQPYLLSCEF